MQNTKLVAKPLQNFIVEFEKIINNAQSDGDVRKDVKARDIAITINNMLTGMYRYYFILPELISSKEESHNLILNYINLIKTNKDE